uniref:NAC domain-containing protein n=1 Tax=Ananas comosus var. bracteatus TaxID=296719 RepID=A0A6V7PBU8_ANACO|nr:unnamed protein product [Ananas comosus var. bracteatus]
MALVTQIGSRKAEQKCRFPIQSPEDRLILEYLLPFALGRITGAESVINDDPYRVEPWVLLDEHRQDSEEGAFFFATKTMVGTRRSRTVGKNGTWRTQTSEKRPVVDAAGCIVAVFRKTLLSYYTAGNRTTSTGYVMYEYELFVDNDGSDGGTTYVSVLCHIRKSCREVARSNKRKRQFKFQATIAAASAAASPSGCTSRSAVLFPCEAPAVIDSVDPNPDSATSMSGLFESRAEDIANQLSTTSLSEISNRRIPPKPACEASVVDDDSDANTNSMVSMSRPPELKASAESAGEARKTFVSKPVTGQVETTGRNSATSPSGTPKSKAFPETASEAPAVTDGTNAKPDSPICLSEPPESTALFESACKSPTATNQLSASPQSALPESRSLRESACETPAVAVGNQHSASSLSEQPGLRSLHESACEDAAFGSEDAANNSKPDASLLPLPSGASSESLQEEPPSDSSYSLGELIDIVETADRGATIIYDGQLWEFIGPFDTIVIEQLK